MTNDGTDKFNEASLYLSITQFTQNIYLSQPSDLCTL